MIYDKISNIGTYFGISGNLDKGLAALRDADFSALENGKHVIDGDSIFMNVSEYQTKETNDTPEAHVKYIDIQYLAEGEEYVGVAELGDMDGVVTSDPEKDFALYQGATTKLKLGGGYFMVLFPQDAHAPGIACGSPAKVRKAVVKVLS